MDNSIGLSVKERQKSIQALNETLADEYVLYTKTRNYHWNVVGERFRDLHLFFETQYEQLDQIIDDVAERCRTLGGKALGTLAEMQQNARLTEAPGEHPEADQMVSLLLDDHQALIRSLRGAIPSLPAQDLGTADFLTGIMEQHEKMAWMLRATLGQER